MRPTFARETITRLRYPKRADHGALRADYAQEPERLEIKRCWLEPQDPQENNDGRTGKREAYNVDAPAKADVLPDDKVEYRGIVYDVDGGAKHVPSPSGRIDSSRITIERWVG